MRDAVLTPLAFAWAATLCASLAPLEGCAKLKSAGDFPDAGPVCAHRQPPGPPEVKDAGGMLDLTLAIARGDLGTATVDDAGRPRYQNLGWDLDHTCTLEGQGPSCIEPSSVPKSNYQDGVDGIDNAFGIGWWKYAGDTVTPEPSAVEGLFRVREYNGMPNDDQVEVSIYYALGLSARDDGRAGSLWPPAWDGQDRWNILPDSLESPEAGAAGLDNPKYVDKNAYVSNGVLVAKFDDALSLSYLTSAPTHLWKAHRVVLAGALSQAEDGTWELRAVVGSRTAITVAIQATLLDVASASNDPICKTPDAGTYVRRVCSFADIAYDDDTGSAMCDATSTGYAFQAKQARLGDVAGPLQEDSPCGDLTVYSCDFVDP